MAVQTKFRSLADFFLQTFFQAVNLCAQGHNHGQIALDCQPDIFRQPHLINSVCGQVLDLVGW